MNKDVLSCKKEAMTVIASDSSGKKKGYIKVMKELWDLKGYKDLGFSGQNLRDQAARLEKSMG